MIEGVLLLYADLVRNVASNMGDVELRGESCAGVVSLGPVVVDVILPVVGCDRSVLVLPDAICIGKGLVIANVIIVLHPVSLDHSIPARVHGSVV